MMQSNRSALTSLAPSAINAADANFHSSDTDKNATKQDEAQAEGLQVAMPFDANIVPHASTQTLQADVIAPTSLAPSAINAADANSHLSDTDENASKQDDEAQAEGLPVAMPFDANIVPHARRGNVNRYWKIGDDVVFNPSSWYAA